MPRQHHRPARGAPPAADPVRRARVVVVEDSALIQEFVVRLLAKEFTVTGMFADGESFIDHWQPTEADIVMLDVSLPGLSGLETAAHLRRCGCELPIVFCSVHEDAEIVHAARAAGALGYVAKRDIATDLVPALRAALRGRQFLSAVVDLQ
jgi:DNA-binding NarL/FixJ family response regulator